MNLGARFKNKTFIVTMLAAIVAFIYQMLGMFGVVPPIAESEVTQLLGLVANILVGLGILVDPTTGGITDK